MIDGNHGPAIVSGEYYPTAVKRNGARGHTASFQLAAVSSLEAHDCSQPVVTAFPDLIPAHGPNRFPDLYPRPVPASFPVLSQPRNQAVPHPIPSTKRPHNFPSDSYSGSHSDSHSDAPSLGKTQNKTSLRRARPHLLCFFSRCG